MSNIYVYRLLSNFACACPWYKSHSRVIMEQGLEVRHKAETIKVPASIAKNKGVIHWRDETVGLALSSQPTLCRLAGGVSPRVGESKGW